LRSSYYLFPKWYSHCLTKTGNFSIIVRTTFTFGEWIGTDILSDTNSIRNETKQLEEATDVGTIAKVDKSLSKAIMQARTAKKMTQKELATAINEKPQVVAEYESGKAVPNPQIISKIERKLGTKLPRPGKSKLPKSTSSTGGKKPGQSAAASRGLTRGGPAKRR
jgi:putative transcription factor